MFKISVMLKTWATCMILWLVNLKSFIKLINLLVSCKQRAGVRLNSYTKYDI